MRGDPKRSQILIRPSGWIYRGPEGFYPKVVPVVSWIPGPLDYRRGCCGRWTLIISATGREEERNGRKNVFFFSQTVLCGNTKHLFTLHLDCFSKISLSISIKETPRSFSAVDPDPDHEGITEYFFFNNNAHFEKSWYEVIKNYGISFKKLF